MEKIVYGFQDTEFGRMIIAQSDNGLCYLGFMVEGNKKDGLEELKNTFKNAELMRSDTVAKTLSEVALNAWRADVISGLTLDLRGTDFQKMVWNALIEIDKGTTKSYQDIAEDIGRPKSQRAVGTAVGQNPLSLIVPCHRVIQKDGAIGNYMWGKEVKRKILGEEGVDL